MTESCISSSLCRHKTILNYFSEESEPCENNCDICTTPKHCDPVDVKREGIIILNCFNQMRQKGEKVTSNLLLLTLLGSSVNEIKVLTLSKPMVQQKHLLCARLKIERVSLKDLFTT